MGKEKSSYFPSGTLGGTPMPGHGFLVENASGGIGIVTAMPKKAEKRTASFILYILVNSMASLDLNRFS